MLKRDFLVSFPFSWGILCSDYYIAIFGQGVLNLIALFNQYTGTKEADWLPQYWYDFLLGGHVVVGLMTSSPLAYVPADRAKQWNHMTTSHNNRIS